MGGEESLNIAIKYHNAGLTVCKENNLIFETATCFRFLGDIYREKNNFKESKKYYSQTLGLLRQNCEHLSTFVEEHICLPSGITKFIYLF